MHKTPDPAGLSPAESEILDRFLSSSATADQAMMMDTLDGYLTAIVLGPVTLPASAWLPGVWGASADDTPAFASPAQAAQIVDLIQRHLSGILERLRQGRVEPMLDLVAYQDKTKEYIDGEMWCYGFLAGIALARAAWQPLFDHAPAMDALLPIYLLGADDKTPAQRALTKTPLQREQLARQIPASVAALYRFWLPYREDDGIAAPPPQRSAAKAGRNDPCPCGSGKKFKKCCGPSGTVH